MSGTSFIIDKWFTIHAPASRIWKILTEPELMKSWISDSDIEVFSERKAGGRLLFKGSLHGLNYEDKGQILIFEPEKKLQYTHLSKISWLPDIKENYSVITFSLHAQSDTTRVTLHQENF